MPLPPSICTNFVDSWKKAFKLAMYMFSTTNCRRVCLALHFRISFMYGTGFGASGIIGTLDIFLGRF